MSESTCFFGDLGPERAAMAGGKGSTLARLFRAGYPVPDGFVISADAFVRDELTPAVWAEVKAALERLRAGRVDTALAVRSSARGEDSSRASFAGEFETVLDVRDDEGVRRAIAHVRRSRHAERVSAYGDARGLAADAREVAVVVQRQVPARYAGVLFGVDPVTGSAWTMVGNYVHGLGEGVVSGEQTGAGFTLRRPTGAYAGPAELKPYARQFFELAGRIERELGGPQDIEWAIADGRIALLQARPITTLAAHDPATGTWNDSQTGDYLWSSVNLGEAVPDVMTPATWSLMHRFMAETLPTMFVGELAMHRPLGNLAGRPYMNLSVVATAAALFGMTGRRFAAAIGETFGRLPEDLEVPFIPVARWRLLRALLPEALAVKARVKANMKRLPDFLAAAPARCESLHGAIRAARSPRELHALWHAALEPYFVECCQMLEAGARQHGTPASKLRLALARQVGAADAAALLSGLGAGSGSLESLGPLLGLQDVARGRLDATTYARRFGHRGPHEFELSLPRPAEDPGWLDAQLAGLREAPLQVDELLARQAAAQADAFSRYEATHPWRARGLRRQLERAGEAARSREAARSEVIRVFWALRAFYLRAGALCGIGDDAFYLAIDELLGLLAGASGPLAYVPARRETHARYTALPTYPIFIRGRFDPFAWAADGRRRNDRFDPNADAAPVNGAITGFPGAAGVVEGVVRVIREPEDGDQLRAGEILVTCVTNVGWTPLFPRAAAVVTDVGAPLSHAAIVARELGIPAVVGCGNATMRLRTGDRVRVDGARGTVEVLASAG